MPSRYVILHHQVAGSEHWDLMLEEGEILRVWQLLKEPLDRSSLPLPARRIGDHRKVYLDFEGPVSGGRGHVRRIDSGTVGFLRLTGTECTFDLTGNRFSGRFRLALAGEQWVFESLR